MEDDEEYRGGGKIEFEENEKERKWLEGLIPGADIEIIVDKEMCEYAEKEGEKISEYIGGDSKKVEDIEARIY